MNRASDSSMMPAQSAADGSTTAEPSRKSRSTRPFPNPARPEFHRNNAAFQVDTTLNYNARMSNQLFDDMKRYVAFGDDDAARLVELKPLLEPHLPEVVRQFYDALLQHPRARAVFGGDLEQVERLRRSLLVWLAELFDGRYDREYFERRCRIGRTHVRVHLPQHYMFTAMSVIRGALMAEIERVKVSNRSDMRDSLNKLLDLELAIMNETYREDLMSRLQAIEHAEYQARLSQSEHLATVGELAASLAHEIKNPLAGISGAIQILGDDLGPDHPRTEIIMECLRQIDRLDAAVKDLLIYARPKPPSTSRVAVGKLLGQVLVLLREEPAFRGVCVEFTEPEKDVILEVDEAQVHQVLTNLFINAAHACNERGTIQCRVRNGDKTTIIEIEDNGIGMTAEVVARAFEPFYTTKAKGTGLGLAICKRIIESHKGSIQLQSRPGHGTCVTIEIPVSP